MRRYVLKASFCALAGLLSLPALAQNRFEGFYVGGYGAYSTYNVDVHVTGFGSDDFDADGFGGGGLLGYGFRNGNLYGAVEGEVGYDGAKEDSVFGSTLEVEAQLTYGLGVRAGWVIQDRYLPFVRVGWQETEFRASAPGVGSDSRTLDALRAGVGFEALLTDSFSLRAEYSFSDYSKWSSGGVSLDPQQHLFRLAGAFYF